MKPRRLHRCPHCGETLSGPPEKYICPMRMATRMRSKRKPAKTTQMEQVLMSDLNTPPLQDSFITRQTLLEGGQAMDFILGIKTKARPDLNALPPAPPLAFPQAFPETASTTVVLMHRGYAMEVTIGVQQLFALPRNDHAE